MLNQFNTCLVAAANRNFGTTYINDQITHWDWWRTDVPKKVSDFVWGKEVFRSKTWTLNLPPAPRALQVVQALQLLGHEFVLVSDRDYEMRDWLHSWLYLWGIEDIPVFISHPTENPKWSIAQELKCDIAIDDAPHNITNFLQMGACPQGVYLMGKPWNRAIGGGGFKRVNNWLEFFEGMMTIQKYDGKTIIRPLSQQERDDNYIVELKNTAQYLADNMYKDIQHQITKFGAQRLTGLGWIAVIMEEFGETVQAYLQKNPVEAKKEAKQAIACLVRLVAEIEREEKGLNEEESTLYVNPC